MTREPITPLTSDPAWLEVIKRMEERREAEKKDLSLRFMRLVHHAERQGIFFRLVLAPQDAMHYPLSRFKQVGNDRRGDLEVQLDIAEAYLIGLDWRDEPKKD
jgi:hypothetical protein